MLFADARQKIQESPFKLKWYKFYTYIILPLNLIATIDLLTSGPSFIFFFVFGMLLVLFWALLSLKKWGYWVVQASFILGFTPTLVHSGEGDSITYAIAGILPMALNMIYFAKRKSLFYSTIPKTPEIYYEKEVGIEDFVCGEKAEKDVQERLSRIAT